MGLCPWVKGVVHKMETRLLIPKKAMSVRPMSPTIIKDSEALQGKG
jgi:hypothetical protein